MHTPKAAATDAVAAGRSDDSEGPIGAARLKRSKGQRLDPLVGGLLPVLLHEFNNQTQLLTGLRAVLELGGGDSLFYERADDLARAGDRTRDLGYILAVLGSALGANALQSRREPRGLALMLDLVALAARRRAVTFEVKIAPTPSLAPAALDGWQAPWAVAAFSWLAVDDAAAGGQPCRGGWLAGDDDAVGLALQPFGQLAARAESLRKIAPGIEIEAHGEGAVLVLPAAWLDTRRRG